MSYHCKPQEDSSLPAYMSDAVVAEMRSGWDLDYLKMGNEETLKGTMITFHYLILENVLIGTERTFEVILEVVSLPSICLIVVVLFLNAIFQLPIGVRQD